MNLALRKVIIDIHRIIYIAALTQPVFANLFHYVFLSFMVFPQAYAHVFISLSSNKHVNGESIGISF
jgi:hypothetical protein